jgi:hypothetical protein
MQVYFSHSYRDVKVNSYFIDRLVDEEIPLRADQKSDVWCVAKLERYMLETTGFLSIIPKRPAEKDQAAYSLYIGHELTLARRARVPRLLFVDEDVYKRHRLEFPDDAVPFKPDDLEADKVLHSDKIRMFRQALETAYRPARSVESKRATLVVGEGRTLRSAAQDIAEILRREGYNVSLLFQQRQGRGLDDIGLLEMLWRAELCVFFLGERLSEADVALAMAHAHCIPSLRLQYDRGATNTNPSLAGVIRWSARDDMLVEFAGQLTSYQEGLVRPVEMALSSTSTAAAENLGTMKRHRPVRQEDIWEIGNGPGLTAHVRPDHVFVRDEVGRVRARLNKALGLIAGREGSLDICTLLYEGVQRYGFSYEIEQPTGIAGTQVIRSPTQVAAHETGTCIDLACLFASLLEAARQNPLLIVLEGPGYSHALAGYRVRGAPTWDNGGLGDLRGAVTVGDAVLFEATGAVHSDRPVGAESAEERKGKVLSFGDARLAAERMLMKSEVRLKHFVDVRDMRAGNSNSEK